MNKFFVAAGILVFSAGISAAADAPAGCADQWQGAYVGAHSGYGFGDTDTWGSGLAVGDVDIEGFMAGVITGYNFQNCDWVFGIESDIGFGVMDGAAGLMRDLDLEPNGHIRGRLGMAYGDALFFGAAGIALADFDIEVPGQGVDSHLHMGLTVGAGVDYMIDPNWVIRGEYLVDVYGKENYGFPGGNIKMDAYTVTLRGAIMYKF